MEVILIENENKKEWIVRFLNLPPKDQVDFLYRKQLEDSIRAEVERKVFGEERTYHSD